MTYGFWTDKELNERLVVAWEGIWKALEGLRDEASKAGKRHWPQPGEQREPVLSRVPNEEDEARKNLGISDGPIEDWLNLDSDEYIGERTAQWLRDHPEDKEGKKPATSAEISLFGAKDEPSTQTPKGKAGSSSDSTADHPTAKNNRKRRAKSGA